VILLGKCLQTFEVFVKSQIVGKNYVSKIELVNRNELNQFHTTDAYCLKKDNLEDGLRLHGLIEFFCGRVF